MVARTVEAKSVLAEDGTITLAADVLERAHVVPGSAFFAYADGPGSVQLRFVEGVTVEELFERYGDPSVTEIDWTSLRAEIDQDVARQLMDEIRRDE